ncbi:MAG: type II toxin-antitoxin system VapC family toxin [Magnetococcales bacterium]|nr:type II toxin-antitoxin system VapC family toxin [Magnetococcales bacterium]MBF0260555.1 type II toxin-antitoxin system VapC family toxin [Magnetococcales bacterium]
MTHLLDTNVISELRKAPHKAHDRVIAWANRMDPHALFLSVITIQELEIGVQLSERRDPAQGRMLRQWMNHQVLPAFIHRILPIDTAVAVQSAKLHVPDPRPIRDGLIAATALVHGMTLVTRNVTDFAATGVRLLNPWD